MTTLRRTITALAPTTLVFAFAVSMLGCEPGGGDSAPGVVASWEFRPDPPDTGRATLAVVLEDSAGVPISGAEVVIEGIMTHPGMVPEIVEAHEVEAGRYEADMRFTMRGDWILLLDAALPDGRKVTQQKELPGVGAH